MLQDLLRVCVHYITEAQEALTEVLGYQLVTAVHDEHTADIEFDVVLLLLVFKKVKGSSPRNEEQCSEFQLTFHREVLKETQ